MNDNTFYITRTVKDSEILLRLRQSRYETFFSVQLAFFWENTSSEVAPWVQLRVLEYWEKGAFSLPEKEFVLVNDNAHELILRPSQTYDTTERDGYKIGLKDLNTQTHTATFKITLLNPNQNVGIFKGEVFQHMEDFKQSHTPLFLKQA